MKTRLKGLFLAVALFCGLMVAAPPAQAATVVRGEVMCVNSAVTGVWIKAERGTSGFAKWKMPVKIGGHSKAVYEYSLNKGGRHQVHVGCGGTSKAWKVNAKSGWVSGQKNNFRCNDVHPGAKFIPRIGTMIKSQTKGIPYKTCKRI